MTRRLVLIALLSGPSLPTAAVRVYDHNLIYTTSYERRRWAALAMCVLDRCQMRVSPWRRREQEVTFHRNGTVWTSDGDTGDWWFDVGGLYWVCAVSAWDVLLRLLDETFFV